MSEAKEHANVRLEADSLSARGLLVTLGAAWLVTVAGILIAWWLLRAFEGQLKRPVPAVGAEPPPPRLLHGPIGLERPAQRERARDDEVLGSYAWVDRERGIVRIPIERAIEIAAESSRSGGER